MNYTAISKSPDGFAHVNQDAVIKAVKELGYRLNPVQGSDSKFWITGQEIKGKLYDLIDGPKYYQLVIERFDFGVQAKGDLNAWQMAGQIKDELKSQSVNRVKKVQKGGFTLS